jgi:hypothetical protein
MGCATCWVVLTTTFQTAGSVQAGQLAGFTVQVAENGAPVTDLTPYLGAASHVVVLDTRATNFGHVHAVAGDMPLTGMGTTDQASPARFGPTLAFSHTFPTPGLYKVWVQFARGGQVHTTAWVVPVQ